MKACFGKNLDPDSPIFIGALKKSFMDLEVSVTPKIHAVFYHVSEFCSKHLKGLGFYSEQAMESVHFDFKSEQLQDTIQSPRILFARAESLSSIQCAAYLIN